MVNNSLNAELMRAVNFTSEDLEANRNGTVTETQRTRLGKTAGITRIGTVIMFVVIILVLVGIVAYTFVFSDNGKGILKSFAQDPKILYLVVGVFGFVILLLFFSALRTLMRTNDLASGKVSTTEGKAKMKSAYAGYGMTSYTMKVGRTKFHITQDIFDTFAPDEQYRIYYVKNPPMNTILSVEML